MASARLLDSLKQMMTCSVCLEEKTDQKMLPCQHTLCVSCLNGICENRRSLNCPICKKSHSVPNGGVKNYPNSLVCNQISDILSRDSVGGVVVGVNKSEVEDSSLAKKKTRLKLISDLETEVLRAKSKLTVGEKELSHHKGCLETLNSQSDSVIKSINSYVEKFSKYSDDVEQTFQFLAGDLEKTKDLRQQEIVTYLKDLTELRQKLKDNLTFVREILTKLKQGRELQESDTAELLSILMEPNDNLRDLSIRPVSETVTTDAARVRPNELVSELQEKFQTDHRESYDQWNFLPSFSKQLPRHFFGYNFGDVVLNIKPSCSSRQLRIRTEDGCEGIVRCRSNVKQVSWLKDKKPETYYRLDEFRRSSKISDNIFMDGERVWLRRDLEYIPELYEPLTESSIGTIISCEGSNVVINFPECENWTGDSEIFEFIAEVKPRDIAVVITDVYDNPMIKFKGQRVRVDRPATLYDADGSTRITGNSDEVFVSYHLKSYHKEARASRMYRKEVKRVRKEHLILPMKCDQKYSSHDLPIIELTGSDTADTMLFNDDTEVDRPPFKRCRTTSVDNIFTSNNY